MSRAKKLIELDSNGTLNKIAKNKRDGINDLLESSTPNNDSTQNKSRAQMPINTSMVKSGASKLPIEILESFSKNKIDESKMYGAAASVTDSLSFLSEGLNNKKEELVVNEAKNVQSTQQIDYPMIRTIVEDIVRKYASSLNKKIISESKEQNMMSAMIIGKTFKFVDQKGNIYECVMKKVGNVNEKMGG